MCKEKKYQPVDKEVDNKEHYKIRGCYHFLLWCFHVSHINELEHDLKDCPVRLYRKAKKWELIRLSPDLNRNKNSDEQLQNRGQRTLFSCSCPRGTECSRFYEILPKELD
jgi:hypothetical protein